MLREEKAAGTALGIEADKLTRVEQNKALSIMKLQAGGGEVRLFSATKRQGIDEISTLLWQWAHPSP